MFIILNELIFIINMPKINDRHCPSFATASPDEYREGVNGSEFKTPGKLHILHVADAKPTTPRLSDSGNEGQCEITD